MVRLISKISNNFLFMFSNILVIKAGIHTIIDRIANREVCTVCLGLFSRQVKFEFFFFFFLFVCCFLSQVNSYGHGWAVSSPNNTFSWASLNKQLTSTS